MRTRLLAALLVLAAPLASASAQLTIEFSLPGIEIGVRQPTYPQLVRVPGYPVYYDPSSDANYFFYDGLYWVYEQDNWYASSWYDGPWGLVEPQYVPVFILRVPVSYYRRPPVYFREWRRDAPPRWGEHWGHDWEEHRSGWDRWNRREAPRPAPLPTYQRRYTGDRYPRPEQQPVLRRDHYQYTPRDAVVKQIVRSPTPAPARPAPRERQDQRNLPQRDQGQQRERAMPPAQPQQPARAQPQAPPPQHDRDHGQPQAQPQPQQPTHAQPQAQPQQHDRGQPQAQPQPRERPDDRRAEPKKGDRGNDQRKGQDRDDKKDKDQRRGD